MCRWVKRETSQAEEVAQGGADKGPKLDLGFKEGQTIKLNLAVCTFKLRLSLNNLPFSYVYIFINRYEFVEEFSQLCDCCLVCKSSVVRK